MILPRASWPKPSPVPFSSLWLLVLNIGATYAIDATGGNIWWFAPFWAVNVLFFWAERDNYLRERRNYLGWHEEMRALLDNPHGRRKEKWSESLQAVRARRKRRRRRDMPDAHTA